MAVVQKKTNTQSAVQHSKSITDIAYDVKAKQDLAAQTKKSGRPRSFTSQESILDSASKLLLHASVRDVSIEAIAKKAGVGKTTIYRWWPNKVAVILDAVLDNNNLSLDVVSGGSPQDMLVRHLERFVRLMKGRTGKIIAEIFAEAQGDAETLEVFYRHFMLAYEEILANIIEQGKASGEFRSMLNTEMAVDMIYGSLFYRLMSDGESLPADFADHFIMEALRLVK